MGLLCVTPVIAPPRTGLVESWDHPAHLVVVNGAHDTWRAIGEDKPWLVCAAASGRNLGCPASWNFGFRLAADNGISHVAILSQGLVIADGTSRLAAEVDADVSWITGPWMCFHGVVWPVDVWARLGGFDETLPTWADVDFVRRLHLAGEYERGRRQARHVSLAADDVAFTAVRAGFDPAVYDADRQRYADKWGGGYGQERFARPWDPGSADDDVGTPQFDGLISRQHPIAAAFGRVTLGWPGGR